MLVEVKQGKWIQAITELLRNSFGTIIPDDVCDKEMVLNWFMRKEHVKKESAFEEKFRF